MTEAEWQGLVYLDWRVVDFLASRVSQRRLRLFSVAYCRLVWDQVTDGISRHAVELAERQAEGLASREKLQAAVSAAWEAVFALETSEPHHGRGSAYAERAVAWLAVPDEVRASEVVNEIDHALLDVETSQRATTALLRDVFGNPFRPVVLGPACQTPVVLSLSQAAYDERVLLSGELEPARLAVLADALEEAGYADDTILSHLRSPGPHVRGCWALDAILGKQ